MFGWLTQQKLNRAQFVIKPDGIKIMHWLQYFGIISNLYI